jgi:hypothetical protein
MTLGPTGTVVPLPDKYVPDSFKEYGVGVNQWSTRATTDYAGDGGIDEVDSFATTTKYLWPEAGCEFGKEDVALVRGDTDALMGGGQMGKMCVVDGDYAHGPLKLPPCEPGAEVKFQFGFSQRTPDPADDQGPAGPIKLNPNPKPTTRLPKRRIRVEVTVEARPGEKRDWRLASVEVISESRNDSEIDPGSPEIAPKLGEDDIATGEWRAIQGVTFLTCESLLDDEAFDASFDDAPPSMTLAPSDSEKTDEQLDEEKMRTRVGQGKGRTGRGRVKKNGVKGTTDTLTDVVVPTVVKSEAELAAEKEAERYVYFYFPFNSRVCNYTDDVFCVDSVAWNLRRRNRPPPTGLVVVPSWAVEAKGPFSSAYEYLVGGNSPLVLLPMRGWCLVESVNDELLVEVGVYAGAGECFMFSDCLPILTLCFIQGDSTRLGSTRLRKKGAGASHGAWRRGGTSAGGGSRARSSWRSRG